MIYLLIKKYVNKYAKNNEEQARNIAKLIENKVKSQFFNESGIENLEKYFQDNFSQFIEENENKIKIRKP